MAKKLWVAVCAAMAIVASAAQAQSCRSHPGDEAGVVQTIRSIFAAATNDDLKTFHALVEPGFYMYDNGQRFDGDAMMKLISDDHAQGAGNTCGLLQSLMCTCTAM